MNLLNHTRRKTNNSWKTNAKCMLKSRLNNEICGILTVFSDRMANSFDGILIDIESWFLYRHLSGQMLAARRNNVIPREKVTIGTQKLSWLSTMSDSYQRVTFWSEYNQNYFIDNISSDFLQEKRQFCYGYWSESFLFTRTMPIVAKLPHKVPTRSLNAFFTHLICQIWVSATSGSLEYSNAR
jgi:hypothetical protein